LTKFQAENVETTDSEVQENKTEKEKE
jgi:hypothetical protein